MADAIKLAGGAPSFLLYVDGRRMFGGLMDMMRGLMPPEMASEMPAVPEGGPIAIVAYGAMKDRRYMGGLSLDVGQIAELVKSLDSK